VQYRGDHSALVSTPQGLRVESSTVPLRVARGGGPVDLGLVGDRDGFAPARPLTGVSIAKRLGGGVTVGGYGVRVSLLGADVVGGVIGGQDVFFGGVGRDMDAVVAPKLDGADLSVVLRSRLAPEQFRYQVALPVGAVLRAVGGGAVVSHDGVVLARIPAPSARDAQGSAVPVQMTVSGDDLVLTVAHRERDLAYPILVDPEVVVNITEDPGAWEFYSESWSPFYCEGEGSGNSFAGCPEGDPLFSHSGPGGGTSLTITMPSVSLPFIRTRLNKNTEEKEEVEIDSGSAEWWWEPSGNEGITSVEFEDVASSGGTGSEGYIYWYLEACRQFDTWYPGEAAPSSERFMSSEEKTCNKDRGPSEPVVVGISGGAPREKKPTINVEAKISVGAVLVTRPMTGEEEEERRSEKYGESSSAKPNEVRCMLGHPVDCATGNQVETQTDLSVGGRGLGLNFTRTYNSQLAYYQMQNEEHGPFGPGWTSSYSAHLTTRVQCEGLVCNEEIATVHQDNGSTVSFRRFIFKGKEEAWEPIGGPLAMAILEKTETGYAYTLPGQSKLYFNSSGQLTSESDRNGNTLTMTYTSGHLESVSDSSGRKLMFAYNSEGMVESVKDPLGHTVKYAYASGILKSVTQPGESALRWQFKYNSEDEMTSETDGRGYIVTTAYDGLKRVISQKDGLGRQRKWSYAKTPSGTETTIIEPNGATTVEKFDGAGMPASVIHASGTPIAATTTYEYNEAGEPIGVIDPNNHKTEYSYDSAGNRTSEKNADGDQVKWIYDSHHNILTITNPDNETTTIKRNSHGEPETISRPGPSNTTQTTHYTYDSDGDLEAITEPLERKWSYEYDSQGDRVGEIDPEGNKRTWSYNEDSQVTSAVSPRGNAKGEEASKYTTKIEADAQGRPLIVTDPLGHQAKYVYDGDGNLESTVDASGHKTKYGYDADNEQTKVEVPNGVINETGYDGAGQVVSQTDGNKHTTKYVRNLLGEVIEIIDPLGRKTVKEYDGAGNLTHVTDAAKRTTTYAYDPANRLKEISYSDGKTPTVKYEYDVAGNTISVTDGTGTTSHEYDSLGRLTRTTNGHGESVGYGYDLASEQIKLRYPNSQTVTHGYDQDGRLQTVTDWLGHQTKLSYDPDSDLTATTFPAEAGNQDKYAYNHADQMSEVDMSKGNETLASLSYTRDDDGQVSTAVAKGLPGEEKTGYGYDSNNRLVKAGASLYGYDAANNPTKLGSSAYTYDSADQLKTGTGVKYAYNEMGQRLKSAPSGSAMTYGYDQAGNVISVERPAEGKIPAIADAYSYDGSGLRASQTVSGSTTYMAWDLAEGIPQLLSDGTNSYVYGPEGQPLEQINNSQSKVLYLHHDQQGSTRLITGSTGKAEATITYDAYGNTTGATGSASTSLGYDGQYTSSDTGLIYLRSRVYDPATAQFLSADPLRVFTGEPYSYTGDNPVNFGDPTGLLFGIKLPLWAEEGIEGLAGWGDRLTFGATKWAREELGDNNVDACSTAYQAGGYVGLVTAMLIPGEDEVMAGGVVETGATDLSEQLALEEAQAGAGQRIMEGGINDPDYPEEVWAKMQHVHENPDSSSTVIHYWENVETGVREGFKFK
jgi:RHS repeat-associated protein